MRTAFGVWRLAFGGATAPIRPATAVACPGRWRRWPASCPGRGPGWPAPARLPGNRVRGQHGPVAHGCLLGARRFRRQCSCRRSSRTTTPSHRRTVRAAALRQLISHQPLDAFGVEDAVGQGAGKSFFSTTARQEHGRQKVVVCNAPETNAAEYHLLRPGASPGLVGHTSGTRFSHVWLRRFLQPTLLAQGAATEFMRLLRVLVDANNGLSRAPSRTPRARSHALERRQAQCQARRQARRQAQCQLEAPPFRALFGPGQGHRPSASLS